ncbi:uncharacterized protein LOC119107338 [Pollicipes pollicipes]|uniref:uncharacterized protein LOC119107338 n=1 Tax=Pollicipes pollicipes TaxID=41117 RepID=UPI00188490EA|nr:uncharacterized protein LOC119107338 [Pollicipes pollicipes]
MEGLYVSIQRDVAEPTEPLSPERRGHVRSASQGTQLPGPSILKDPERAGTAARRGHARAFSHGQIGMDGLDDVQRASSRTEFTLPPGHVSRERSGRGATGRQRHGSRADSLFRGHSRQASRSESVYTLRQTQQSSSIFDYLCFWKKKVAEEARLRVIVPNHTVPPDTPAKQHPNAGFLDNYVRTTKYTLLSFLPKNLFEQFHRFANLYFLFIVLLNWVPEISAFGKEVAMLPLVFVMGVTAIKDLFEDRRRYLSDRRVNTSTCRVYDRWVPLLSLCSVMV